MPKGLKRYYGRGHLHFITFSCYGRRPLLRAVRAKNLFLKELARVRREYAFALVGYVVMPEHVHLLVSEPKKRTPSTVLQMLKQRVSRKMRQKKTGYSDSAGALAISGGPSSAILAGALLRFQCVHREKETREA